MQKPSRGGEFRIGVARRRLEPGGAGIAAAALLMVLGCGSGEPATEGVRGAGAQRGEPSETRPDPPTARRDLVELLRADQAAPRHPSDGAGKAWIDGETAPGPFRAGETARIVVRFEAGPLGVAAGGAVTFQPSLFWGWSEPQTTRPGAPGYTRVSTPAEGVRLDPEAFAGGLLRIGIGGRALRGGEGIRIEYGAGPAGARVDRFAEREAYLWIAVDGDGDGVRKTLARSPFVEILPGPAARLFVALPSVLRPGERGGLVIATLDRAGNRAPVRATLRLEASGGLDLPAAVEFSEADRGALRLPFRAGDEGVVRVRVHGPGTLEAESNPLLVSREAPRILWGDLHGHSGRSDGTGTPADYLAYAREVAGLDVAALTDHDHWGMRFLDENAELWAEMASAVEDAHAPGRFVALLGYEWTSWIYGHRHVLFFEAPGPVRSALDPAFETPEKLWAALRGRSVLTIPHHPGGGPIAIDWSIPPDPELEPVVEVVSVHGSSEAPDTPGRIYDPVEGHTARDALDRGYRLGFVGSGDSHDGHPGLAHVAGPGGGLAALWAGERSRAAVLQALRARHTYATNGPRIGLFATLDGRTPGEVLERGAAGAPPAVLRLHVLGTAPIERIELVGSGAGREPLLRPGRRDVEAEQTVSGLRPGDAVYLRVVQRDGGTAWSSPWFVGASAPEGTPGGRVSPPAERAAPASPARAARTPDTTD